MFRRISLRIKLTVFAALVLVSSLTALAYSRGALFGKPQPQQQPPVPIFASYFNPAGLPVRIVTAAANAEKNAASLSYSIINTSGSEISGLDLVLFEFDRTGKLLKSQAWNLQTSLKVGANLNFSQRLKPRLAADSRLVLSVEAVRGDADISRNSATHWQVGFTELAQTVAILANGGRDPNLQSTQRSAGIPELSGAAYCSDAFAKAFQLSKLSDGKALSSFTCDRNERTFVFGFNGKDLIQK
ncbi:MAG TPA: hypothetical protein PLD20_30950 [Blastocatellia bacterium]|nr:hypothetical protein [Blastocatellia bacterium]HMV86812.1 hypothetical protein [Blastocatellia bacterium]HMX24699.1 hypothetical protein [Blastocatellia bacterium]HMY74481.1 hypothetical protein [Blastocatellia bacterium]HMZ22390.1 hypothetical protein [Blastocatellia bacterium]